MCCVSSMNIKTISLQCPKNEHPATSAIVIVRRIYTHRCRLVLLLAIIAKFIIPSLSLMITTTSSQKVEIWRGFF